MKSTQILFRSFSKSPSLKYPISVAPMIDISTPHYLHMLNLIHPEHSQYTEMIHTKAIIRYKQKDLEFKVGVPPTPNRVIQLGGCNPEEFVKAGRILEDWGFSEININIGCPSDNVQSGNFGVILMKEPFTIVKILEEMCNSGIKIPITVKCRIGVDDLEEPGFLVNFVQTLSYYTPIQHFIIHCRKAWLKGLSPKKNRNIPPLKYDQVYNLIESLPHLNFTVNGGITTVEEIKKNLMKYNNLKQVMIGRKFMSNPYFLKDCLLATNNNLTNNDFNSPEFILKQYSEYSDNQFEKGHKIGILIQPTLNLLQHKLGNLYKQNLPNLLSISIKENWKPSKLIQEIYNRSMDSLNRINNI